MHSNLLLPTATILLALLVPFHATAGANETDSGVRIAMPVDKTRSLKTSSLRAARRALKLRSAGRAGSTFYLQPAVTGIAIAKRGAGNRVRCSVQVSMTESKGNVIESRATLLKAKATVITTGGTKAKAKSECLLHASWELRERAAKLIAAR